MMLSSTLKQNKWSTKQRWIAQRNVMPFWLLLLLHFLDVQWRSYGRKFWWLWIYIDFESLLLPPYRHPMVSQPSLNTQNGKPIECFTNASTPETWYNIEASCEENLAKYCTHDIHGKEVMCYDPHGSCVADYFQIALPNALVDKTICWYYHILGYCAMKQLYDTISNSFHDPTVKQQCSQCRCRQCQLRSSKATNWWYGHPSTSKKCPCGFVGGSSYWPHWTVDFPVFQWQRACPSDTCMYWCSDEYCWNHSHSD